MELDDHTTRNAERFRLVAAVAEKHGLIAAPLRQRAVVLNEAADQPDGEKRGD
jgi:hypothetical protein